MKVEIETGILAGILDSLVDPVVFVDLEHKVRYLNAAAAAHYKEGWTLLGRSVMECHNEQSRRVILEVLAALEAGEAERLITDKPEQRIYMRAVRDETGGLIGYYERYEPGPGAPPPAPKEG